MAIKISIGKLILAKPLSEVINQIAAENMEILPISTEHILRVSSLPFHHRDPFDRIIVAQSLIENLPIITDDAGFAQYSVKIL
jgi:PIN domain nuclease of toxin-antitoxin system